MGCKSKCITSGRLVRDPVQGVRPIQGPPVNRLKTLPSRNFVGGGSYCLDDKLTTTLKWKSQ